MKVDSSQSEGRVAATWRARYSRGSGSTPRLQSCLTRGGQIQSVPGIPVPSGLQSTIISISSSFALIPSSAAARQWGKTDCEAQVG